MEFPRINDRFTKAFETEQKLSDSENDDWYGQFCFTSGKDGK